MVLVSLFPFKSMCRNLVDEKYFRNKRNSPSRYFTLITKGKKNLQEGSLKKNHLRD